MPETIARNLLAGNGAIAISALFEDVDAWVYIVDLDGRVLGANRGMCRDDRFPAEDLVGRALDQLFEPELGRERIGLVRHAIKVGKPVVVHGQIFGRWRRTAIRPLQGESPAALVVCRVTSTKKIEENNHGSSVTRHDAGELACLTKREQDVLSLIGHGLSTAQIAKHLHRSVKTIEWHRVSLGNKLKVTNRVELARIAIRAGFCDTEHELVD